jgi:hypothetical protein
MRSMLAARGVQSFMALLALLATIASLLFWLSRRVDLPRVDQLRGAASIAGFLLVIAATAGVAAMATVQFWKALFQPRSAFHSSELEALFGESLVQVLGLAGPAANNLESGPSSRPDALNHLLDNPTEIVMGQLRSTADYILLRPKGFEKALSLLAGDAGKSAVQRYLTDGKEQSAIAASDSASLGRSNEALVEVRFFVEQHLNLIHVRLKERWRRRVRVVAVAVAGFAGLLIVSLSSLGPAAKGSAVFAAVVWGGFFSWLARDIAALIERRRN